jgi:pilus assembly protein Flp/PilA
MRRLVARFLDDECGATAIEYCLIAAGLSIVIVTAVNGVGSTLSTKFSDVSTSLK